MCPCTTTDQHITFCCTTIVVFCVVVLCCAVLCSLEGPPAAVGRLHSEAVTNEKALTQYFQLLQQFGVGKIEEQTERFCRLSTQIVVDAVMKTSANGGDGKSLNYTVIDIIYSHLIPLLLRSLNDGDTEEHLATQRIALLNKAVGGIVRCTMWDYESKKNDKSGAWDQRPWFRLLLNLTVDMDYYEAWNPWLFRHSFPLSPNHMWFLGFLLPGSSWCRTVPSFQVSCCWTDKRDSVSFTSCSLTCCCSWSHIYATLL